LDDYIDQKKQGLDPVFVASKIKGLENVECWSGDGKKKAKVEVTGKETLSRV